MQLIFRCTLIVLALAIAGEASAQRRPLGRAPRGGPPCGVQPAVCTVSAPLFTFGRHSLTSSTDPIYAQGSVTVNCDKIIKPNFPVTVTFDLAGIPPSDPRQLASAQGSELDYNLYLDPVRTRIWGDGSRGTDVISDTLEIPGGTRNVSKTYLLYGRVNGGQPAAAGNYLGAVNADMKYGLSCQ